MKGPSSKPSMIKGRETRESVRVYAETEHFRIRSIVDPAINPLGAKEDEATIIRLYSKQDNPLTTAGSENEARELYKIWVKRLRNQDPFTGLIVEKKDDNKQVAMLIAGHGKPRAHAQDVNIVAIVDKEYQNQKMAKELSGLLSAFQQEAFDGGYQLYEEDEKTKKEQRVPFSGTFYGTAHPKNIASQILLQRSGFTELPEMIKAPYGPKFGDRIQYERTLNKERSRL